MPILPSSPPKPDLGIAKVGKQATAVKAPKLKAAPDAFAPPSVFFGKSESEEPKHPSLRNLWSFMNKKYKKKESK